MSADDPTRKPDRWERMEEERRKRRWRDCIVIFLIVGGMVAFLVWTDSINHRKRRPETYARLQMIGRARQIGLGLLEFKATYGNLPDASTIPEIQKRTGTNRALDDSSSNGLFEQLLVTKLVPGTNIFGAFDEPFRLSHEVSNEESNQLGPGECGFAYVLGSSSGEDPKRPLAFAPVIPGTQTLRRTPKIGPGAKL